MSAINELREELARTETAQFVTTMLRDISATRLQSIRAAYEANEKYFIEIHRLVQLLQEYAATHNIALPHSEKKRVIVAITSNKRFYGTLNTDVVQKMYSVLQDEPDSDCFVIGDTGRQLVERGTVRIEPTYDAFGNDTPTVEEMQRVVQQLASYAEVVTVHPTYINAFQQEPKMTDVTHVPAPAAQQKQSALEYLFEPDIPAMLHFFKTQIRLVLFDRIMLETRLALTGARLMKMQRARERTEEMLLDERRVIHKEIRTMQSMRLLETFTGFRNDNAV